MGLCMKEKFMKIPSALQKQLLIWFLGGALSMIMFMASCILMLDLSLIVLYILFAVVCLMSGWVLWEKCVCHKYVVIEGTCTGIERFRFHRYIRAIQILSDDHDIEIVAPGAIKYLAIGDAVSVYVAENVPIYETDGRMVICSILAITKGTTGKKTSDRIRID